ncbi:MAG: hypothetical protein CMI32_08550 [Opitutales bacterium]|nr:hypothetical protein [Opitutales bacterium]
MAILQNLLTLGRVSNLPTIWTNCLAAWTVNRYALPTDLHAIRTIEENAIPPWSELGWLLLGASLLYVAGCTLNDAFDQDFDQRHNPQRPIPSGKMPASGVWLAGFAELGVGAFILLELSGVTWIWLAILTALILLYDAIHKKWSGSVWLMGSCRFFLWLAAASAANENLAPLTFGWGGVVAFYVVGISFLARNEATGDAKQNLLSIPLLFFPFAFALYLLLTIRVPPELSATVACTLGAIVSARLAMFSVKRIKSGEPGAVGKGVSLLLAGIAASDAAAAGLLLPAAGWSCLACVPIALALQKKFAAT